MVKIAKADKVIILLEAIVSLTMGDNSVRTSPAVPHSTRLLRNS